MTRAEAERQHETIRVQQTQEALRTFSPIRDSSHQVWRHDRNEVLLSQLDAEARAWERLAAAIERANSALERGIMLKSQLEPQQ